MVDLDVHSLGTKPDCHILLHFQSEIITSGALYSCHAFDKMILCNKPSIFSIMT